MSEQALEQVSEELAERFGPRKWNSLKKCKLNVDAELGVGLDKEAHEFGYLVTKLHATPGQDKLVCEGDVIVSIGGDLLIGLETEAVAATFARHLRSGTRLVLVESEELRQAATDCDSRKRLRTQEQPEKEQYSFPASLDEVSEGGARVKVPLGTSPWKMPVEASGDLQRDLAFLGENFGVKACANFLNTGAGIASVTISGTPDLIGPARAELVQMLQFYQHKLGIN
eukprot:TRINITY_DN61181_c0_g1_i1.p1 TRINITY_DN61181_c0_g1~~TRINITY_DN61181_c0_g1_i1.p1  ORF type:complete len:227 (+),score=58.09 TRINITY_DN61181_c0_g1_i1:74-754(+)